MFEFDETFSDISSSSSIASFDFTELLDPSEEFQLLSRSFSLEALPPAASTHEFLPPFDDVPPFPPNRRCAVVILGSDDETRATLTIPTTRMANVLKEPSVVNNAVCDTPRFAVGASSLLQGNQTMNFELYEHLPWEDTEHAETKPYVPER